MGLAKKLNELIKSSVYSYQDIANELSVSKSTVHNWANERMPTEPKASQLMVLARLLKVSTDYLADDTLTEYKPELSPDDEIILRVARALNDTDEALRRLTFVPHGASGVRFEGQDPPRGSASRDAGRHSGR